MKTVERIGNGTLLVSDGPLKYIEFECLNKFGYILKHCMSTRIGGVSSGECSTLNLGFNRNDSREHVLQNYRLLCNSVGLDTDNLVISDQVHGTTVRLVGDRDRGKGFSKVSDIKSVDGLMTIMPEVAMVTYYADCVPIFLFEPEVKAAALLHSGWKGTLNNIAAKAAAAMRTLPGFKAERLVAAIGPSIGSCCFEVGDDVYKLFKDKYPEQTFYKLLENGKRTVDLQGIIKLELLHAGLLEEKIYISDICTKCRKDLFFSHRGDNGRTGSLAAFMQINTV